MKKITKIFLILTLLFTLFGISQNEAVACSSGGSSSQVCLDGMADCMGQCFETYEWTIPGNSEFNSCINFCVFSAELCNCFLPS